jgi:hypothetical protein
MTHTNNVHEPYLNPASARASSATICGTIGFGLGLEKGPGIADKISRFLGHVAGGPVGNLLEAVSDASIIGLGLIAGAVGGAALGYCGAKLNEPQTPPQN